MRDAAAHAHGKLSIRRPFGVSAVATLAVIVGTDLIVAQDRHHFSPELLSRIGEREAMLLLLVDVRPSGGTDLEGVKDVSNPEWKVHAPTAQEKARVLV